MTNLIYTWLLSEPWDFFTNANIWLDFYYIQSVSVPGGVGMYARTSYRQIPAKYPSKIPDWAVTPAIQPNRTSGRQSKSA